MFDTTIKLRPARLEGPAVFTHFGVLVLAVGYFMMVAIHRPPLAAMVGGELLPAARRSVLLRSVALWSLTAAVLLVAFLFWSWLRGRWPTTLGELVAGLWPLTLLPLACYVVDIEAWAAAPVLLFAISTAVCAYCVVRTELPLRRRVWSIPPALKRYYPWVLLGIAIATYVTYVSFHTILNHRSLGTAAYDLGIQENIIWNTVHGDLFVSTLMDSHYLGVHTSLVLLLVAPIYALVPAAETLLGLQALVLGMAALPLYLLSRKVLERDSLALLVALLWLTHPAVGGANFYDFHPVAFSPFFLFIAVYFWWCRRWRPFWISIALLLSVKEEMAIIVVLLGLITLMGGNRRQGFQLLAVGAASYVFLQHMVIPHFAGGEHSYAWYYTDLIPSGEGPHGMVTTALLNPVFALDYILTEAKALFVFQVFAPLAFLSFFTFRGAVLISYSLAAALFASRPYLHQIGFQYALTLLALAFIGALLALHGKPAAWRRRALAAAVLLAIITCFHYGMIWPRHNFTGGFHTIDFGYSEHDQEQYRGLREVVDLIPVEAVVLASETLVPHVAGRHTIATARYARKGKPRRYDYILVHNNNESIQGLNRVSYLDGLRRHEIIHRNEFFVLYKLREDDSVYVPDSSLGNG
jgi:uncharacterized membrane protein